MNASLVWLASYPRSGNTWLRVLIANAANSENTAVNINQMDEGPGAIASSRAIFEDQTLIDSGLLSHEESDAMRPAVYRAIAAEGSTRTRFFKVHDAYTITASAEPLLGALARGAIYIVRDPRAVAVSMARYFSTPIDLTIAGVSDNASALCGSLKAQALQLRQKLLSWSGHVRSWLDQQDLPVHLVRYEDLRSDTTAVFDAAIRFAGETADPDRIEKAVRHSSFAELQRQEIENGFRERLQAAPFFRRRAAGGGREVLSIAQADRIVEDHHEVMHRLGYLAENDRYVCPEAVGESCDDNPPKN